MPIPSNSPDYSTNIGAAINANTTGEIDAASGAILLKQGKIFLTKAGVAAMTLALPTAVTDDFKTIVIISTTANAHTITTPTAGINGALHIVTFAAAVGSAVELTAYNGSWWAFASIGATLS